MRISSSQMYSNSLTSMLNQQAKLAKTQQQLSTGQRLLNPSDDPVGTVQSLELNRAQDQTSQYIRNADLLDSRLRLEESVVGSSIDVVQRIRELTIQANNDSQGNESRLSIASELRQQLDNLLSYANTKDSSGHYIFAGYQEVSTPFSKTASGYTYNGDDGQRELQIGPSRRMADGDPGSEVFMGILNGNGKFIASASTANTGTGIINAGSVADVQAFNRDSVSIRFSSASQYDIIDDGGAIIDSGNYLSGGDILVGGMAVSIEGEPAAGDEFSLAPSKRQDIFSMVESLAESLESPRNTQTQRAAQHNEINAALSGFDRALDHFIQTQSNIGSRMESLQRQVDINEGASLQIAENLSMINDLDYAEAISRFSQQQAALQAAQQAFAKTQGLSLFNYI
ncbi:flagellar hook-associated protein FlgL [Zhongshania marina]|uniref:Flagellar hook-associated protein 3 n=1 Tax=Zhongshania marina TaxID=2304603 RepID=A0ABX9W4Y0_9GAMM|nr:flagellar hook-associated protein 3 [Zhongshania marina]